MAYINFDCPECGHNLEVDEGGAGFIVKCPECDNPLQIPELPRSHRIRKIALAAGIVLAVLLLCAANLLLWARARDADRRAGEAQQQLADLPPLRQAIQEAQVLAMGQETELARLRKTLAQNPFEELAAAARAAVAEAESLAQALEGADLRLLEVNEPARVALLRKEMRGRIEAARVGLPAAPTISDVDPGLGVQGRQIVFAILPGRDGQTLRENAEVTGIEGDKVFFKFAGGTAGYSLNDLHLGVAAYLPVDPLLVLPRSQWQNEVIRIHQVQSAQRDEKLRRLRARIEALPATEEP